MITHNVIVEKPRVTATVVSDWYKNLIVDQQSYNNWLNAQLINVDDFVTMMPHTMECTSLVHVHYVAKLETDFNKLKWRNPGTPSCFIFVQCATPNGSSHPLPPWCRWDNPSGYRLLTVQEYDKLIKDQHDNLQSNCIAVARQLSCASTPSCQAE